MRVLLDAMASGAPVVGADCGEISNVIGSAGLLFPEGDSAALAAALWQLIEDGDLRQRVSQNGRARVLAHFTQAQVAAETVSVYRRLAGAA